MMRVVSLWAPAMVFVIGLLITQGPVLNPDALEMGLVGQGFWGDGPEGLDPHYYPPVFPFLSAVFSVFLPGHAAVLLLSPLAMGGLFMCLWAVVDSQKSAVWSGWVLVGVMWSSPALRDATVGADPRAIQLVFLYAGMVLVLLPSSRLKSLILGGIAGLLVLTRPEGFLFAGLLLGGALLHWRKKVGWAFGSFACVVVPYLLLVSRAVGSVSLNSRSWEIKGAALLDFLPVRSLVHLWGAGAQSTPFRDFLHELGPQNALPKGDFFGSIGAAFVELGGGVFPVLWPAIAGGFWLLLKRRRFLLLLLAGAVVGSAALYLVPMGRDLALPLNNLLPGVVALHVLACVGILEGILLLNRRGLNRGAWGAVVVLILLCGWDLHEESNQASPSSYREASSWMKSELPEDVRVASSLGSSPIVRLADRTWVRIPSRWERVADWRTESKRPEFLVLTSTDGLWMLGPPQLFSHGESAELSAFFRDEKGWVLVIDLRKSSRGGQFHQAPLVVE